MTRIVLFDPGATGAFLEPEWAGHWTEVWTGSREALAERLGFYVEIASGQHPPVLHGNSAHLWLYELDQLNEARETGRWETIVFEPSALSVMDAHRIGRSSLVTAQTLSLGHVLREEDIAVRHGGHGLPAHLKLAVVGMKLCYPLDANQEITFGNIE